MNFINALTTQAIEYVHLPYNWTALAGAVMVLYLLVILAAYATRRVYAFIGARFGTDILRRVPFALLTIGFVCVLVLLASVTGDVMVARDGTALDTRTMYWFASLRSEQLTQFFGLVTLLGEWYVVLVFLAVTTVLLWVHHARHYIVPLFLTVVGAETLTAMGKLVLHRPRPELALFAEHSFSFPSAHATVAVAFYGFLVYLLMRRAVRKHAQENIFFAGLVVILFIGVSRLYLGVHYVTDVWGGFLVGALWLVIGIGISEWLMSRQLLRTG